MSRRLYHEKYEELKKAYLNGWKTWNVNSVLSYVHMPDALAMNLCIKEYSDGGYLRESLIGRFPEPTRRTPHEVLFPGDHALDDSYTSMKLTWCGLEMQIETASDNDNYFVLVTPLKNQPKPALLVLETGYMWNHKGHVDQTEEGLCAKGVGTDYQIRCTKELTDNDPNFPTMTHYIETTLTEPVAFYAIKGEEGSTKAYTIAEVQQIVETKKEKLHSRHAAYGKLDWMMQAMECAIAWDTIYDPKHNRVISPVSRLWSIGSGGYVLFDWDTYFASVMAAFGDCKELAYSNLIEITNERTEDGFIPNFAYCTGQKSADRSQPPVGSAMLLLLYNKYKENWIIEMLYDALLEWNTWFWNNRRAVSGAFCWGSNPIPVLYGNRWESDGVHDTFGAALESGLDNSPMYDDIPFNKETNMLELEDVGLTGLYIMDCDALLKLGSIIGRREAEEELKKRKAAAEAGLNGMWNESYGFFCNRRTDINEFSYRVSPTNFYALYSTEITKEQISRIMKEHYYNSEEFYGEWMLPSIAKNDPAYPDQEYWRGRVWAPLNFLTYLAMKQQGCKEECKDLAEKSIHIFEKEWMEHRHVHENYNSITGEGCDSRNSDKFYHWGALLSVIAIMENENQ